MIIFAVLYAVIGVVVFAVLQAIVGAGYGLIAGILWLPMLIIGIISNFLRQWKWSKKFLSEAKSYPEETNDDLVDAFVFKKREFSKVWLFWLAIGVVYELYAIITNKVDTLSERVWYWIGKYWVLRVAFILFWVWAFIHIVFGPCAFGIC